MDSAFPQPQNDLGEDDTMRDALLRKAMEAERLQAYLERIVDRISDLEKYFECTKKGEHAEGTYSPRGGDYRMNQARDRTQIYLLFTFNISYIVCSLNNEVNWLLNRFIETPAGSKGCQESHYPVEMPNLS